MKLATTLEDIQYAAGICLKCGCCTYGDWPDNHHLCPLFYRDECFTHGGGGFLSIVTALAEGKLVYDQKIADLAYTCAGCLVCDSRCTIIKAHPPQVDIMDMIRLLRHEAVKRRIVPEAAARHFQPQAAGERHAIIDDLPDPLPDFTDADADTVVFIPSEHLDEEISTATTAVLSRIGKPVRILGSRGDCGAACYDFGFWDELKPLMEDFRERINPLKNKRLIFTNPHDQEFIARRYPEITSGSETINPEHISQFLAAAFKKGDLRSNRHLDVKVSYHDPCYLGRGLGIYDAPRQILEFLNGVELVEMKRIRQSAFCCGARALGTYFDRAATVSAEERLEDFFATGADVLITACPYCKQHFRSVLPPDRRNMVKDLVEIVAEGVT